MTLFKIYQILLNKFGAQGWWPVKAKGGKRKDEIIIGAILTQATSWKNAEKALLNLKKEGLVDLEKINRVSVDKLAEIIKPAGFFNLKAKRLKNFVFNASNNTWKLRNQMLDIDGLGPETVDSILLYAYDQPVFVIDAYTKRFTKRHPEIFPENLEKYDDFQAFFICHLPKEVKIYKEFHALIVKLSKDFCQKKPHCEKCPLIELKRKKL